MKKWKDFHCCADFAHSKAFLVVQLLLRSQVRIDVMMEATQLQADAGDPWILGGGLSQKLKTYMQKHAPYLQKLFQVQRLALVI